MSLFLTFPTNKETLSLFVNHHSNFYTHQNSLERLHYHHQLSLCQQVFSVTLSMISIGCKQLFTNPVSLIKVRPTML